MGWKTFLVVAIAAYVIYQRIDRFDPASIKDKRVVVTGASTGIGEEIAYRYARFGARILITARRESVLKQVAAKCKELGAKEALYIPLDMAREEDAKALIDDARKRLGGLDHLILNHIINSRPQFWGGSDFESVMQRTMDINFRAYVRLATLATPMLRESKGSLGVVSSGAGKLGMPFVSMYCASKFALHGFFDSLRQEYDMKNYGISITTFVLGGINTTNVMNDPSKVFNSHLFDSTPPEAALAIVKGTANREREVRFPGGFSFLMLLRDALPESLEWVVRTHTLNQDTIDQLLREQGN